MVGHPTLYSPLNRDERVRIIAERNELPGRGQPVFFGGRYRYFPLAELPIEALVSRFDNGRLAADIEEHAAAVGTPIEELHRRSETEEVQRFLHTALLKKARDPSGPIFAELERLAQQTEPLTVLFDGIVVNGNRRLAAMRELLHRDHERYGSFRLVDVAVLPEGTRPSEIEYVEASLQMAPETKLAYGWIDRRLKLRKHRDLLHLPIEDIRAAYRIEETEQIDRELAELALAEDYLDAFRGEPAHYSAISDAGELFIGLGGQLAALHGDDTTFWRVAAFAMIEGRDEALRKRMEQLFPFAAPVSAEMPRAAKNRLARRFEIEGAGDLADDDTLPSAVSERLLDILRDRERSSVNARLIAQIVEELRIEHGERNAPELLLRKVREAGRLIARLEPERLTAAQRRSLRVDLSALTAHGTFLLGEIEQKPTVPVRWVYTKSIIRRPYWKVPLRALRRVGLVKLPNTK